MISLMMTSARTAPQPKVSDATNEIAAMGLKWKALQIIAD
jgi:hypothetical protein